MRRLALIAPLVMAAAAEARGPGIWFVGYAPDATDGWVTSLSQGGDIGAGFTFGTPPNKPNYAPGFTWTLQGGRYDFGLEGGLPSTTAAYALSADGQIIAGYMRSPNSPERAYRRVGGVMQDLGVLPLESRSYATGVSGDGQIVVGTCEHGASNSAGQAFRWTEQGGMKGLGYLKSQSNFSKAYGISRDGSTIVGMSQTTSLEMDAFSWTEAGGMQELPCFEGAIGSVSAFAANADGSIAVGYSSTEQATIRPARWVEGKVEDLGVLPGFTRGIAYAVDDTGTVVGGTLDTNEPKQAFIWTEAAGMSLLRDFLGTHGVDVPEDYRLEYVYAVSGDGLTFAGLAKNLVTKQSEGFVATIPAPPSSLLFIVPAALGRRRRTPRRDHAWRRRTG